MFSLSEFLLSDLFTLAFLCSLWKENNQEKSSTFLKLTADNLLVFKCTKAQVNFLKFYMKFVEFMQKLIRGWNV